jgi:hypothetical protein
LTIPLFGQPCVAAVDEAEGLRLLLTLKSNGFRSGLYLHLSVFNHSCTPNCVKWSPAQGLSHVRTLRPVRAGEVLLISYLNPVEQTRQRRRCQLRETFGFLCACPLCVAALPSPLALVQALRCNACGEAGARLAPDAACCACGATLGGAGLDRGDGSAERGERGEAADGAERAAQTGESAASSGTARALSAALEQLEDEVKALEEAWSVVAETTRATGPHAAAAGRRRATLGLLARTRAAQAALAARVHPRHLLLTRLRAVLFDVLADLLNAGPAGFDGKRKEDQKEKKGEKQRDDEMDRGVHAGPAGVDSRINGRAARHTTAQAPEQPAAPEAARFGAASASGGAASGAAALREAFTFTDATVELLRCALDLLDAQRLYLAGSHPVFGGTLQAAAQAAERLLALDAPRLCASFADRGMGTAAEARCFVTRSYAEFNAISCK